MTDDPSAVPTANLSADLTANPSYSESYSVEDNKSLIQQFHTLTAIVVSPTAVPTGPPMIDDPSANPAQIQVLLPVMIRVQFLQRI